MGRWWRCGGGVWVVGRVEYKEGPDIFPNHNEPSQIIACWSLGAGREGLASSSSSPSGGPVAHKASQSLSGFGRAGTLLLKFLLLLPSVLLSSDTFLLPLSPPAFTSPPLLLLSLLLLLSITTLISSFLSLAYLTSNLLPTHPPFPRFCLIVILPGSAD